MVKPVRVSKDISAKDAKQPVYFILATMPIKGISIIKLSSATARFYRVANNKKIQMEEM